MKVNFRQGIVSHQAGAFLQISGAIISILTPNRPVTVTLAHKNTNYTHSEDNTVNTAWIGPFTETRYWLYWDFNFLTFERTFGHTTLEPVAQSIAPGSGNSDITGAIPGNSGNGSFLVDEYYNLPTGKLFNIINSTTNNGSYTVAGISYDMDTGKTTINVNETVATNIADGEATLDFDSKGDPLFVDGRHWFNTKTTEHFVLNGNSWQPILRVFAAQLFNANSFISLSQNSQHGDFTGTQIGDNSSIFSGRIFFGEANDVVRRDNGTFFTTEDQLFTNQSRVDAFRLESNVTKAQCVATAISEFSVVAWVNDGQINPAQYNDVGNTVVGILTEDLLNGEVGGIIVQGAITNPSWNWTQGATPVPVGSTLWVDNGALVTTDPNLSNPLLFPTKRVPVARVLDKDTIIFEQGLGGIGETGPRGASSGILPADSTNLGGVTLVTDSTDPLRAWVISDTDPRLTNARAPLSHTHLAGNITYQPGGGVVSATVQSAITELGNTKLNISGGVMTGLLTLSGDPQQDSNATTKRYVDNLVNGLIWLDPIDGVNFISDVIDTEPSAPNLGDSYILPGPAISVGSPSTWIGVLGEVLGWDGTVWNNLGQIQDIHTGTIRVGIAMQSDTIPSGNFLNRKNQIVIYTTSGVFVSFEIPVLNNAVYVDGDASLFAFDQYAFNGTSWVKFGGSNTGVTADGLTTVINGGVLSVIPATGTPGGGQVDALMLNGNTIDDLNNLYAAIGHGHGASTLTFTPYVTTDDWGTPIDSNSGSIIASNIGAALNELADTKAEKNPLYATVTDLPAPTEEGMLATVQDDATVYFADGTTWQPLSRGDHVHNLPYDMAFYVHGTLLAQQKIGIFAVARDVFVSSGATGSIALAGKATTSLPTTLLITRERPPYNTSPINVGSITFAVGSTVGTITWNAAVSFVAGDMLVLSTDSTPSDLEQVAVTIVGCSQANTCTLPALPTVSFVTGTSSLFGTEEITDGDGSVNITGVITSITWTQPRYSTDGGSTFIDAPDTITFGKLIFDSNTIQVPSVSEAAGDGAGLLYEVVITVTGPGGTVSDTQVIAFIIS